MAQVESSAHLHSALPMIADCALILYSETLLALLALKSSSIVLVLTLLAK
jgi:hypothetical protein